MVNVARMMGLGMDPDEFPGTYNLFEAETRRRVWWDVYYYDLCVVSPRFSVWSIFTLPLEVSSPTAWATLP